MKSFMTALLLVPAFVSWPTIPQKVSCKTSSNVVSCYWTHGRLAFYNGAPSFRLWKTGTHRLLGIHSGPGAEKLDPLDNEHPVLPENVRQVYDPLRTVIFADFEICPLEPEHPGRMQAACIESAKNLVLK